MSSWSPVAWTECRTRKPTPLCNATRTHALSDTTTQLKLVAGHMGLLLNLRSNTSSSPSVVLEIQPGAEVSYPRVHSLLGKSPDRFMLFQETPPGLACSAGPRKDSIRPWGSAWAYLFRILKVASRASPENFGCGNLLLLWLWEGRGIGASVLFLGKLGFLTLWVA